MKSKSHFIIKLLSAYLNFIRLFEENVYSIAHNYNTYFINLIGIYNIYVVCTYDILE